MRRLFVCLAFAALAVVPAAHAAPPVFFVSGHGWGHGIGMPQYGAQGFASREGRSYDWILAHYYRGTTLAKSNVGTVRVLLAEGRTSVTIGSTQAFTVTDAKNRTFTLAAGNHQIGTDLRIKAGGQWRTLASPARFTRGTAHLRLGGKPYRGRLVLHKPGTRLSVVNTVGIEPYLYGVVPDEVPPSWHRQTLMAQAVAARSYAIVSRKTGGIFDLYADTRSQVYNGVWAEDPRTTEAIDATKGQVVAYDGAVAWTFFHSTSGGQTAAIQHVWNTTARPYLVSVPDPHSNLSPYHSWGPFRYTAKQFRARLGASAPKGALRDAVVARNASKRVSSVRVQGALGSSSLGGTTFQSRFGLRSSWFSIGVLQLGGKGRIEFGGATRLTGVGRGFKNVWLERRRFGGSWQRVRDVTPAGDGTVSVRVSPNVTSWFRLASPRGKGAGHRVQVVTTVTARPGSGRAAVRGAIAPARAGAPVQVQRRANGRWTTVARAQTTQAGAYRARVRVTAGTYRALAKAGPGYPQGASPTFLVG